MRRAGAYQWCLPHCLIYVFFMINMGSALIVENNYLRYRTRNAIKFPHLPTAVPGIPSPEVRLSLGSPHILLDGTFQLPMPHLHLFL